MAACIVRVAGAQVVRAGVKLAEIWTAVHVAIAPLARDSGAKQPDVRNVEPGSRSGNHRLQLP